LSSISQPPLSFGATIISPLSARQSSWPNLCQPVSDDPLKITSGWKFWLAAKTADPIATKSTGNSGNSHVKALFGHRFLLVTSFA
jgi:hypothetical protein